MQIIYKKIVELKPYEKNPRINEQVDVAKIVAIAREFIQNLGGFEKFAEWGLY